MLVRILLWWDIRLLLVPATICPVICHTRLLPNGFGRIYSMMALLSPMQNMGAITDNYTAGEAAVMAVEAGIDMILMPDDLTSAVSAVIAAVENGTISEERINESVGRILTQKEKMDLLS